MNVLSLFDGIACGRVALDRIGETPENYFAYEIDKYAIQVAKDNWPDIQHLGDVTNWRQHNLPEIDLLIGGSPCQGFSFAGKQLNFEDPRSKLFFTYVDILRQYKPKYFLLENVKMKKEFQDVISEQLEVAPIEINSALVSAQSRKRLYWTNIPNVTQPEDKGIMLKDILESGDTIVDTIYNHRPARVYKEKGPTIRAGRQGLDVLNLRDKSKCVRSGGRRSYGRHERDSVDRNHTRKLTPLECERLQTLPDNYTASVSNTQRYKALGNGWTVDVIAHILKGANL